MSIDIKVPFLDGSDAQPETNSTTERSRKMCKSRAEGGLRCSAHTKTAMVNAAAAVEAARTRAAGAATPGQRDKANAALAKAQAHFEEKQAQFLTSPAGIELIESKAQEARLTGDDEKAARFQEQAKANKAVREQQKAAAAVVQADYNWLHYHHRFDINGYNKYTGFSRLAGWNYKTDSEYDAAGYNFYGRDRDGYDRHGCDRDGYDRDGYDEEGYDENGYNANGYDRYGYDKNGYDHWGYNTDGYDAGGYNQNGDNVWHPHEEQNR